MRLTSSVQRARGPQTDACSNASKWQPFDPSASGLAAFAEASSSRADSVERVFSEQHAILTTSVCIERSSHVSNTALLQGSWFKYHRAVQSSVRRNASYCRAHTVRRPSFETGITGGAWLPNVRVVVPCPAAGGMLRMRSARCTYCWAPTVWKHAPANETTWLRGLTLVASESHISNMHHWSRDMLHVPAIRTQPASLLPPHLAEDDLFP